MDNYCAISLACGDFGDLQVCDILKIEDNSITIAYLDIDDDLAHNADGCGWAWYETKRCHIGYKPFILVGYTATSTGTFLALRYNAINVPEEVLIQIIKSANVSDGYDLRKYNSQLFDTLYHATPV